MVELTCPRHLRARLRARASVLALAIATLSAPVARADEAPTSDSDAAAARTLYQQGMQAFQQKRFSEAALHFEAAADLRINAVTLYTAGLAWDNASRPERAADAYGRALDAEGLDAKQSATAAERVGQLERTLGTVSVQAPEGTRVQLDSFTEVNTPARLHASAGVHVLTVRMPGKPIERRDVTLDAGQIASIEIKEPEPPPPVVAAPVVASAPAPVVVRDQTFWTPRRVVGASVGVGGLALLGGAVLLGLSANDAEQAYTSAPSRAGLDHARSLETTTNVAFIAGGVLFAAGAVLVLWPSRDAPPAVGLGPSGATFRGTF